MSLRFLLRDLGSIPSPSETRRFVDKLSRLGAQAVTNLLADWQREPVRQVTGSDILLEPSEMKYNIKMNSKF